MKKIFIYEQSLMNGTVTMETSVALFATRELAEQKKFIGNAVEVNMSRVLCEALARKLTDKAA